MAADPHQESRRHPAQTAPPCWCSVPLLQGRVQARTQRASSAAGLVAWPHLRSPRRRTRPSETAGHAGMLEKRTDAHPLKSQAAERCVLGHCVSSDSCPRHRSAIPLKLLLPLSTLALHPTLPFTPLAAGRQAHQAISADMARGPYGCHPVGSALARPHPLQAK